jgi:hypothetical protein
MNNATSKPPVSGNTRAGLNVAGQSVNNFNSRVDDAAEKGSAELAAQDLIGGINFEGKGAEIFWKMVNKGADRILSAIS